MNPLLVIKSDGKRLIIDLDRVVLFEEINIDTVKAWFEGGDKIDLSLSLEDLAKAIDPEEETNASRDHG